jgi:DNA transformation protein and related proteins
MPVTASYRTFILELLNRAVPPVRGQSMFSGVGLYAGRTFFGLIANDVVYFKTDSESKAEYEVQGMMAFRPHGDDSVVMSYYQVPEHVLEDTDLLRGWAERAIAVARAKPKRGGRKARRNR